MESIFGIATSVVIGISLAASCGFRVFMPLVIMSIAVKGGMLELADGWSWIGSWPALIAFLMASITEVVAFYIPWIANLLDALATPAAVIAGTITTAACVSDMHPLLKWSAAIIAGGGLAGAIQTATVGTRWTSTLTTGGLGDFVVATVESVMSLVLSVLAILMPIAAGVLLCLVAWLAVRLLRRRKYKGEGLVADVGTSR